MEKSKEILDQLCIKVEWKFVPQSKSRNAGSKTKSLNWIATVFRGGWELFEMEYTQGIGNVPFYTHAEARKVYYQDYLARVVESGKYHKDAAICIGCPKLPEPNPVDFIGIICSDFEMVTEGLDSYFADYYKTGENVMAKVTQFQKLSDNRNRFIGSIGAIAYENLLHTLSEEGYL